ncbi:MAG: nucleoside triphosphate pyrophosphohydrolase [Porticoccaceae bacterium]|nr:nucleoside triphosphate pyrophosphohydrolase [Porticoccaceae bacterium]
MTTAYTIDDLRYLMQRLRDPRSGCPWDLKQTYQTIAPYTLEEVYEVIDAIERNDLSHLREELGDLLFQVIFYSQLGAEQQIFDFDSVVHGIVEKLVRRHPHVFPQGTLQSERDLSDSEDSAAEEAHIKQVWEQIKKQERADKGERRTLDDIPAAMPALSRAHKLQKRAASTGFDWDNKSDVLAKLKEEIAELEVEIQADNSLAIEDELGDLLFSCVNLSRHLGIDPERAMRGANNKFQRRFEALEILASEKNRSEFSQLSLDEMELLWTEVKSAE